MTNIVKTKRGNMILVKVNIRRRCIRMGNFETKVNKSLIQFFGAVLTLCSKSDVERKCIVCVEINQLGNDFTLGVDWRVVDSNDVGTKYVGFGSLGSTDGSRIIFRRDAIDEDTVVEIISLKDEDKAVGTGCGLSRRNLNCFGEGGWKRTGEEFKVRGRRPSSVVSGIEGGETRLALAAF